MKSLSDETNDWICDPVESSVPRVFWPSTCDTRELNLSTRARAVTLKSRIPRITFASGKATIPLSEKFAVTVEGDSLTGLFGAQQDHKLEVTFVDQILNGVESNFAAQFVRAQAMRAGTEAFQSEDRAYFRELGDDVIIDGRNHEVTHWQIGAANCVFTMTLTAPLPSTNDNRDFMYDDLEQILNGVGCVG